MPAFRLFGKRAFCLRLETVLPDGGDIFTFFSINHIIMFMIITFLIIIILIISEK